MEVLNKFRYFIITILSAAVIIFSAYLGQVLLDPVKGQGTITEIEKDVSYPSLTICPYKYRNPDNYSTTNATFEELDDILPSVLDNINITLIKNSYFLAQFEGSQSYHVSQNLSGLSTDDFNVTWREGITMMSGPPLGLVKCATMNLESRFTDKDEISFVITIIQNELQIFFIEFHEKNRAHYLYNPKWQELSYHSLKSGHKFINLQQERTEMITDCEKDNDFDVNSCVEDFIEYKLDCSLPWHHSHREKEADMIRRKCQSKKDNERFFQVSNEMKLYEVTDELKNYGCLKSNCVANKWIPQTLLERGFKDSKNDGTFGIIEILIISEDVKTLKYIKQYGIANFLADVGGYLGLLLGASILSLVDFIIFLCTQGTSIIQ